MAKSTKVRNSILDQLQQVGISKVAPFIDEVKDEGWFTVEMSSLETGRSNSAMRSKLKRLHEEGVMERRDVRVTTGKGCSVSIAYRAKQT